MMRTTIECTHTYAQPPLPHGLAPQPTPDPTTALKSSERGAAKLCTHTESPGTVYTHRALLLLHFIIFGDMDCDPAPPFPLFYRDLFIHFPAAAGREFCEYLPRPVCV